MEIQVTRERLVSARAQGLLDPVLEYLRGEISRMEKPVQISGPEWPLLVAERQGTPSSAKRICEWLDGMSDPRTTEPPEGA